MSENLNKEDLLKETRPKDFNSYTYSDYLTWNDDQRYEIIGGVVYNMAPAPCRRHQRISMELGRQFSNYLLDKKCEVYLAPFDVRLPEGNETDEDVSTVVQPDLVVVCDPDKLDERGCKGAPALVIEIVSPSSARKDRKIKRELYERHEVKEYWLVDYHEKTVEVYLLNDEKQYSKPDIYTEQDMLPVSIFDDLEIDLQMVFRE